MIYFRFNCGNMWGLGHLYRNLILMENLRTEGFKCVAVINKNSVAYHTLASREFATILVDEDDNPQNMARIINSTKEKSVLFIDRLDINSEYISTIKELGLRVITYDDYDKSALQADVAINTRRIPVAGTLLPYSGPRFQLLRRDVEDFAKKDKLIKKKASKVLLSFGGTDPLGLLQKTFRFLTDMNEYEFEFVAGKDQNTELRLSVIAYPFMKFVQDVDDFAKRIYEADLCIVAGGVSMYEVSAIGTPMINISHNADQNYAASIFAREVGSINLGIGTNIDNRHFSASIRELMNNYERRKEMSERMKFFVPSGGAKRVCEIIKSQLTGL